jgi:uncharacterized protein YndB with AHSA1/START domain
VRFSIEQRYDAPPDAVMAAYTDPDLYDTFHDLSKVAVPEVLSYEREGDRVHLRLQMRFTAPLSSAARAVVDPTRIRWVQDERYDLGAGRAAVVFEPDDYADRFSCSGGYTFVATDGGCVRTTAGDLRIRVPLVGGQVERAMVSGLREHFAEEQPLVAAWLARP